MWTSRLFWWISPATMITLVRGALRARGLYVSDERLRKLLRRYCFDLYKVVRHAPRRKRVAVDSDDECLI